MTVTEQTPSLAAFRLHLRLLVTRPRMAALGLLGLIAILVGVGLRFGSEIDPARDTYDALLSTYCLSVLAPVTSLVFASAVFGDLVEDGTLVYLWLKPVARWRLVLAGYLAACVIALPVTVFPATVAAAITGTGSGLAAGAAISSAAATLAYCAIFLWIGLLVRRALVWGLAYVLIWEHAVAHNARGAARLAVFGYSQSLLARVADRAPPKFGVGWITAVVVLTVIVALSLALAGRLLSRAEVP